MIQTVFNPSVWWLLLPATLLALAGVFPAQQYVHIFQMEAYKLPQFFLRLKEEPTYGEQHSKAQQISFIIAAGCMLILMIPIMAITNDSYTRGLSYISTGCFIISVFMLFRYLKWKKQPSKEPLRVTSSVIRLNVTLWLLLLITQLIIFLLSLMVKFYLDQLLSSIGWNNQTSISMSFLLVLTILPYGFVGLPRLLALASIIVQPIESALLKKKDY